MTHNEKQSVKPPLPPGSASPRSPHPDVRTEALELVGAATESSLTVRLTGGLAVVVRCPSASAPPLKRPYKDLDLVGLSKERKAIEALMIAMGYRAAAEFNLLQGQTQLLFEDQRSQRHVDVFLDRINMCHELSLADRLDLDPLTIDSADLLLSKLQIVETTERDLRDIIAILVDCDIDVARIASVLSRDWGWWRTATEVLSKAASYAEGLTGWPGRTTVAGRIDGIRTQVDTAPKGMKWRARARLGDRARWYELPEETRSEEPLTRNG